MSDDCQLKIEQAEGDKKYQSTMQRLNLQIVINTSKVIEKVKQTQLRKMVKQIRAVHKLQLHIRGQR